MTAAELITGLNDLAYVLRMRAGSQINSHEALDHAPMLAAQALGHYDGLMEAVVGMERILDRCNND